MTGIREDRPDAVIRVRIVWKAVKEDDGESGFQSVLVIRDLEDRRANGANRRTRLQSQPGKRHRARRLQEVSSLHDGRQDTSG